MPGALMRQGLSGRHGSHARNSPRGIAPPVFPRPLAHEGRSACLASRSSVVQGRHCVSGSPAPSLRCAADRSACRLTWTEDCAACTAAVLASAASAKATARLAVDRLKSYASEGGPTTDVGARRQQCEAGTRPERFLAATSHRAIRGVLKTPSHRALRHMSS